MLDGIWSIDFGTDLGKYYNMQRGGIVVLKDHQILGGDSNHYYIGSYEVQNEIVQGEIEGNFYVMNLSPIFGGLTFSREPKIRLGFSGKVHNSFLELQGFVIKDPDKKMAIGLTKRAELP